MKILVTALMILTIGLSGLPAQAYEDTSCKSGWSSPASITPSVLRATDSTNPIPTPTSISMSTPAKAEIRLSPLSDNQKVEYLRDNSNFAKVPVETQIKTLNDLGLFLEKNHGCEIKIYDNPLGSSTETFFPIKNTKYILNIDIMIEIKSGKTTSYLSSHLMDEEGLFQHLLCFQNQGYVIHHLEVN